jgi:hypothetical protein
LTPSLDAGHAALTTTDATRARFAELTAALELSAADLLAVAVCVTRRDDIDDPTSQMTTTELGNGVDTLERITAGTAVIGFDEAGQMTITAPAPFP